MINKVVRLAWRHLVWWPLALAFVLVMAGYFSGLMTLFFVGAAIGIAYSLTIITLARRGMKQVSQQTRPVMFVDHLLNYQPVEVDGVEVLIPNAKRN